MPWVVSTQCHLHNLRAAKLHSKAYGIIVSKSAQALPLQELQFSKTTQYFAFSNPTKVKFFYIMIIFVLNYSLNINTTRADA